MLLPATDVISELCKAGDGNADPWDVGWLSAVDAVTFYVSAVIAYASGVGRLARFDANR